MLAVTIRPFLLALAVLCVSSCQGGKLSSNGQQGVKTPVCVECYQAVTAARRDHPNANTDTNEIIKAFECPCCKVQMSVYIKDGTAMVKCGGCASDGVAWDRCRPAAMPSK